MNYLEASAAIIGFIATYLYMKQHLLAWPISLLMVTLYFVLFFQVHLYADMMTQFVFFILQLYGWYYWLYGGEDRTQCLISKLSLTLACRLGAIVLVSGVLLYIGLIYTPDAQMKAWDALGAALSLVAQWMLGRKIIENWLAWLVADMIYLIMYLKLHLFFTATLYIGLIILAVFGYLSWEKRYRFQWE